MKYYLAGPMSGYPQMNIPMFDRVAQLLREWDYDIVSPAELDDEDTRKAALANLDGSGDGECNGQTWGDFLARDVKLIADGVQGIILMPGWENSRGARLEAFVAVGCGHDLLEYTESKGGNRKRLTRPRPATLMKKITQGVLQ